MITLRNISEQCRGILGKGSTQELIQASINAYAKVAKTLWYEGKKDGITELQGSYIYTFKNLIPTLDEDTDMYYIEIPSSYLALPNDWGINQVSWMKGQRDPFVRLGSGAMGLFAGLQSEGMGGNSTYTVEGNNMYFPKMTELDIGITAKKNGILLKIAIGYDQIDVDEQLNIPPNVMADIVAIVVQQFGGKPEELTDKLL